MECNNFNLMSALYVAEFLRICSQMPRLQTVEIWDACGWNFGIYKSYAHTRRPTYFTYMMMKELQDRQIPISGLSENDSIRILATRNSMGSEAAILVINLDKPSRTIQFSLPAGQRFIGRERQGFSGPSLTTDNEKGIKIAMNTQPMTGDVRSIEVPEYSVTLILGEISQK
jgi:hypothetical protein